MVETTFFARFDLKESHLFLLFGFVTVIKGNYIHVLMITIYLSGRLKRCDCAICKPAWTECEITAPRILLAITVDDDMVAPRVDYS